MLQHPMYLGLTALHGPTPGNFIKPEVASSMDWPYFVDPHRPRSFGPPLQSSMGLTDISNLMDASFPMTTDDLSFYSSPPEAFSNAPVLAPVSMRLTYHEPNSFEYGTPTDLPVEGTVTSSIPAYHRMPAPFVCPSQTVNDTADSDIPVAYDGPEEMFSSPATSHSGTILF